MIDYDEHSKSTAQGIKRSLFDIVIFGPLLYVAGEILTVVAGLILLGVVYVFGQEFTVYLLYAGLAWLYYWFLWGRNRKYRELAKQQRKQLEAWRKFNGLS